MNALHKQRDVLFLVLSLLVCVIQAAPSPTHVIHSVNKDGFHRDLVVTVATPEQAQVDACSLFVVYDFPKELFVDMNQVRSMLETGQIVQVTDTQSGKRLHFVDVEKHASKGKPFQLTLDVSRNEWQNVVVPFHARYQSGRPDGGLGDPAVIPAPVLCTTCEGQFTLQEDGVCERASSKRVVNVVAPAQLQVAVPVGALDDRFMVDCITCTSTLGASFGLAWYALCRAGNK